MVTKKETKAQRIAREKKEDVDKKEKTKLKYVPRLFKALERVCEKDWTIYFENGVVTIRYYDCAHDTDESLDVPYAPDFLDGDLILLECALDEDDKKIEAAKIKEQLRQSALAKLTEEERKALGYI